jgi:SAM-dependent methyltransferase
MTPLAHSKIIGIEDFSNSALTPYLEIASFDLGREFGGLPETIIPDARDWECAMALRTFDDFGLLEPGNLICGVGAGTAAATFALADRGCIVFATDRYLDITPRSHMAPASMMVRPGQYTRRPIGRGSVIPVHADARTLGLPSNHFDAVFASGEIARLGSPTDLAAAMEEVGRVLKPGGVASVVAEFRLEGPNGIDSFEDDFLLLTPDLVEKHIVGPSGLELLDRPDFTISESTYDGRAVLKDFGSTVSGRRSVDQKKNVYPNLVIFHQGFLFCPIHLALRKPLEPARDPSKVGPYSIRMTEKVEHQAVITSGVLTQQMRHWKDSFGRDDDEIGRKNAELSRLNAAHAAMLANDQKRHDLEWLLDNALAKPGSSRLATRLRNAGYRGFAWRETQSWAAGKISSVIGELIETELVSEGRSGTLCYGPYLTLPLGRYRVELDIVALGAQKGQLELAVIHDFGAVVLAARTVPVSGLSNSPGKPKPVELLFDLNGPISNVEFRVICDSASNLAVSEIRLFERELERLTERPVDNRRVD